MSRVPEYFFQQSAALPYRSDRGKLEILLVTSRRKKRWVLPKGVREPDLDSATSAAQEALEEAGIEGEISQEPIGTYQYDKWGGTCTVEVFIMSVHTIYEVWQESYRDRLWVSPEEAAERVEEKKLKKIILDFAQTRPDI